MVKIEDKENKVLSINLDGYNIPKALVEYLNERKTNPILFGAIQGYVKSVLDKQISDKETKENVLRALQQYVDEHFWAGIFLAKTKPELVKTRYDSIKDLKEDKGSSHYIG